jgi:hypothetical protein
MPSFILGAIMGVIGLIGLFLASRAVDGMFYVFGLLLFLFGIGFIFSLITRHTGQPRAGGH